MAAVTAYLSPILRRTRPTQVSAMSLPVTRLLTPPLLLKPLLLLGGNTRQFSAATRLGRPLHLRPAGSLPPALTVMQRRQMRSAKEAAVLNVISTTLLLCMLLVTLPLSSMSVCEHSAEGTRRGR